MLTFNFGYYNEYKLCLLFAFKFNYFLNFKKGDEIVGINNKSVKGKTKVEVARMIQAEAVG